MSGEQKHWNCAWIYIYISRDVNQAAIAMAAVLSWFLIYFWCEYKKNEGERERKFFICKFKYRIDVCILCALFTSFYSSYIYFWWQQVLSIRLLTFELKLTGSEFFNSTSDVKGIISSSFGEELKIPPCIDTDRPLLIWKNDWTVCQFCMQLVV